MKMNLCKFTALLIGIILSLSLLAPSAMAADPVTVELPVQITAEGTLPKTEETYTVRMSAGDPASPMPNGQIGGSYDLPIVGLKEETFPIIEYSRVGIYTYTVELFKGSYPDCKYDPRIYTVKVTVTNAEDSGFHVTVALHESGKEEKPEAVVFHNKYKLITSPPGAITPTGVSDRWMLYLIGSAVLLLSSGYVIVLLRRKEK